MVIERIYDSMEQDFRAKGIDLSEANLIKIIESDADSFDVYHATILLRRYGTMAAIPALQKAMQYPKQDVKITALWTIAEIAKERGCALYVEALQSPQYREKYTAIHAIKEYCDDSAIVPVIQRVKKILSRKRRGVYFGPNEETELTCAVDYLHRCSEDNEDQNIQGLFSYIRDKWDFVWDHEKQYLTSKFEFFNGLPLDEGF